MSLKQISVSGIQQFCETMDLFLNLGTSLDKLCIEDLAVAYAAGLAFSWD